MKYDRCKLIFMHSISVCKFAVTKTLHFGINIKQFWKKIWFVSFISFGIKYSETFSGYTNWVGYINEILKLVGIYHFHENKSFILTLRYVNMEDTIC